MLMVSSVIRKIQGKLRNPAAAVAVQRRQVLNGQFAAAHGAYTC